ncbi:uncharacterized protein J3D65DRAFT_691107 [Phyllosticta citribraziliensis]|uniref:Uncharacterized protein n=1 Tax=Phyllosticta citribraziliensis TaxID=989973 RepID=A0ABR1M5B2_9PEZI
MGDGGCGGERHGEALGWFAAGLFPGNLAWRQSAGRNEFQRSKRSQSGGPTLVSGWADAALTWRWLNIPRPHYPPCSKAHFSPVLLLFSFFSSHYITRAAGTRFSLLLPLLSLQSPWCWPHDLYNITICILRRPSSPTLYIPPLLCTKVFHSTRTKELLRTKEKNTSFSTRQLFNPPTPPTPDDENAPQRHPRLHRGRPHGRHPGRRPRLQQGRTPRRRSGARRVIVPRQPGQLRRRHHAAGLHVQRIQLRDAHRDAQLQNDCALGHGHHGSRHRHGCSQHARQQWKQGQHRHDA